MSLFSSPAWQNKPVIPATTVASALLVSLAVTLTPLGAIQVPHFAGIHAALEALCVAVSFMAFLLQFYARAYSGKATSTAIARTIPFLGVGLLNLLHLIYSSDLPDPTVSGPEQKANYFWLATRLLETLAFLAFAVELNRGIARPFRAQHICLLTAGYTALSVFLALALPNLLPLLSFEDQNLTSLRAGIEVSFLITCLLTAGLLFRAHSALHASSLSGLIAASLLIGIAGICIGVSSHPQNSAALLGHLLRVVAYFFLSGVLVKSALAQPHRRLQALDESMRTQSDRLRKVQSRVLQLERLSAVGKSVSSIVHDLNNTLMVAMHSARKIDQLVQAGKEKETDSISRHANTILRSLAKTQSFQSLLTKESRPPGAEASASICLLLEQLKPLLKAMSGAKVSLITDCSAEMDVAINQLELEQLLLILAGHAKDAIGEKPGTIAFQVKSLLVRQPLAGHTGPIEPGRYLVLSVRHNGEGIKNEDLPGIFDPPLTAPQKTGDSGMGLSTVKELAQNWGAGIQVDSNPETGTEFRIFLPLPSAAKL